MAEARPRTYWSGVRGRPPGAVVAGLVTGSLDGLTFGAADGHRWPGPLLLGAVVLVAGAALPTRR